MHEHDGVGLELRVDLVEAQCAAVGVQSSVSSVQVTTCSPWRAATAISDALDAVASELGVTAAA